MGRTKRYLKKHGNADTYGTKVIENKYGRSQTISPQKLRKYVRKRIEKEKLAPLNVCYWFKSFIEKHSDYFVRGGVIGRAHRAEAWTNGHEILSYSTEY